MAAPPPPSPRHLGKSEHFTRFTQTLSEKQSRNWEGGRTGRIPEWLRRDASSAGAAVPKLLMWTFIDVVKKIWTLHSEICVYMKLKSNAVLTPSHASSLNVEQGN